MKRILYLFLLILFFSCDKEVGEDGIVIDDLTGERIVNVNVSLNSKQGDRLKTSDSIGYFSNYIFFSCGIASCNDDYTLTFEKEGFEDLVIDRNFSRSDDAEYVTEGKRDTLIIRLKPL